MSENPVLELTASFNAQRRAFDRDPNPDWRVRDSRLSRLLSLTESHENDIVRAIDADFGGRSAQETRLAEVFVVRASIRHARSKLKQWMRTRRVPTGAQFRPGYNRIAPQPVGVAGVVSPWNYPFQLALGPAIAALAAGNRVLIKPSELTPQFAALLERLVQEEFAAEELSVSCGDAAFGAAFVALPFNHLLFTGSTDVGRQVALAAAKNLTPVTLELGGKSPAIFDPSCDIRVAIPRLAFGKLLNAGQTCIAPDYLLVPSGQAQAIAAQLEQAIARLYPTLARNSDYTAIISERHRQRLRAMLSEARDMGAHILEVNPASERFDDGSRKLAPALVLGATPSMRLMREEIFGPVLPIVEYANLDAAIAHVNQSDSPLALYWFGRNAENRERVLKETRSGGVTVNDCLWHLAQESQPFGGVGASGMGAYHGQWGFDTFSKLKPVFHQARWNGTGLLYPPYGSTFERVLAALKRMT